MSKLNNCISNHGDLDKGKYANFSSQAVSNSVIIAIFVPIK